MADLGGTVGAAIDAIHAQFQSAGLYYGHGTDNAWDEAVALVLAITQYPDDESALGLAISNEQADTIAELANQRTTEKVPLAYLLGYADYCGERFVVRPGVLVPRSPLGFLLQDGLQPWLPKQVSKIADLCAGTGCLGILAALHFPEADVVLVETDELAIQVAAENIHAFGLQDRVSVLACDVTQDELPVADLVICNPPYVDAADMATLPAEYRAEPSKGLAAGEDGLQVILPVLENIRLNPGGMFLGEVGNSARALANRRPMPYIWLDLPSGGEGVFVLEAEALNSHTARQL